LRQRSIEALRLKASRGDLHRTVAVGYVRSADNRIELDPNKRVREAIYLAFRKFAEIGSVRQVGLWLIDEGIKMPVVVYGQDGRIVEWRRPRYSMIYRVLTNPIYAGVYAYGRTGSKVRLEAGRKVITRDIRRQQADWDVLIRDHHQGAARTRSEHRLYPQSPRGPYGKGPKLDARARERLPQGPPDRRIPRWRARRTWRSHSARSSDPLRRQQDDRRAFDQAWRSAGKTGLHRRALRH
jgi:hypothetical protein